MIYIYRFLTSFTMCQFWLLLGLSCAALTASAQSEPIEEETIVYGTRVEQSAATIPMAVTVIDKDEIQTGRQQLGIDESLGRVAGVFMQDRYNFAQDLRISIRGFGARSNFGIRGVKVIVDDIPETLPDGQGQVDAIDIGSVERIEIIKGASSALYGNAAGGVINIISESGGATPFVESRVSFGSDDFSKYQIKTGGQQGRLNYLIGLSHLEYDGYRAHSETRNTQINSRFNFDIDPTQKVHLVVNTTDQPVANDPGGITRQQAAENPRSARQRNVDFDGGEALKQQKFGVVYTKKINDVHQFRLRNYFVNRDFSNKLPFVGGGAVAIDRRFTGGGATYTYSGDQFAYSNQFVIGIDIDQQDDDRTRFDNNSGSIGDLVFDQNEKVSSLGVFLQNEMTLTPRMDLTVGARFDKITFDVSDRFLTNGDDSGKRSITEFSPMAGVVYTVTPTTNLYANVSTAFESPTTTEFANPGGAGGFNPDLNPQYARNIEAGLKGSSNALGRYELSVFRIEIDDELIPFELETQPGRDFFNNAGSSTRSGLEFALSKSLTPSLAASFAYTYADYEFDTFVDDNGNDFSGHQLPGLPKHLLYGALDYKHSSGLSSSIDLQKVGDLYTNNANTEKSAAYVLVNWRIGKTMTFGDWQLEPFLGVNNLLDEDYFSNVRINAFGGRFFEPAPGRNVYGGLGIRYSFTKGRR